MAALWTLLIFFYHAAQYSKFTRYYLVVTPFLALCAAWFLESQVQKPALSLPKGPKSKVRFIEAVTAFVFGATLLWALAVTSIYTRPHTRVAASRWIYERIPGGTAVANETGWDESLPLYLPGHPPPEQTFRMSKLELYDLDTPEKRVRLLDTLDQVEWIFISSNRVWGTVPRVPQRWPLTTAYFRALFNGQLGFALAQQFTSYPQLSLFELTVQFPDDTMEEAITVYDHPRVMLFHKTPAWSRQKAEQILDPSLLKDVSTAPLPELRDANRRLDEGSLPWPPVAPDPKKFLR